MNRLRSGRELVKVIRIARRAEIAEVIGPTVVINLCDTVVAAGCRVCRTSIGFPSVSRSSYVPGVGLNGPIAQVGVFNGPRAIVVSSAPSICSVLRRLDR